MIVVVDEYGHFTVILRKQLDQACDRNNSTLSRPRVAKFRQQCYFAVIVEKTDPRQSLMRGARAKLHSLKVAQINTMIGKPLMELDHQRFILIPYGTYGDVLAALHSPGRNVLHRVGPNSGPWQFDFCDVGIVQ